MSIATAHVQLPRLLHRRDQEPAPFFTMFSTRNSFPIIAQTNRTLHHSPQTRSTSHLGPQRPAYR